MTSVGRAQPQAYCAVYACHITLFLYRMSNECNVTYIIPRPLKSTKGRTLTFLFVKRQVYSLLGKGRSLETIGKNYHINITNI